MTDIYNGETLLDDLDKVVDFLSISKEEFLTTYSYLKESDYEDMKTVFENDRSSYIGTWWNCAEKLVAELVEYPYNVTGEELKTAISNYIVENITGEELIEVQDLCVYN